MLTEAWSTLRPHTLQSAAWRCKKRFVVIPAGRGSGKTELGRRRLVRMLPVKKPWSDPKYFFGAPTVAQAKRVAWRHIKKLIPPGWIVKINESEMFLETIFGSQLYVVGMDKPQRIEGEQWDGAVLDENCDLRPGTFDLNILPALTHRDGWCWRIGVPKRQGPGAAEYKAFFLQGLDPDDEHVASFTWPSSDILSSDALAYARSRLDAKDYREQFEASWETIGGQIFHAYDSDANVRPCHYDSSRTIVVGSDFNVDPMCWVLCHRWANRLEVFDELFIRNTNTPACLDALWGRYQNHEGGFEFYGDATGAARKTSAACSDYLHILNDARFKTAGRKVAYLRSNPPVADRFAAMNALLCNADGDRRLHIDPRCKRLIWDLAQRSYKTGTTIPDDSGDVGHMTDALGYPVYVLFPMILEAPEGREEIIIT